MNKKKLSIRIFVCVAVMAVFIAAPTWAHDGEHPEDPNPSPNATVSQEVGYAKVTVAFGRPGVKGRNGEIWGKLVPYNGGNPRPWGAGANGNSVITFEEDVTINGQALAAGTYGLLMIPSEKKWIIVFSKNGTKRASRKYTKEEDALRIEVSPEKADYQEWLIYEIEKTGELSASLSLHWENLKVGFTIDALDHRMEDKEEG